MRSRWRDAVGHAPVGEEVERPDGRLHGRRLALGAPDDDAMALLDLVLVDRLELEGRHVDEDVAAPRRRQHQLADAAEVEPKLRQPVLVVTLSAGKVDCSTRPVGRSPLRRWKRRTPADSSSSKV